ncbi:hypothetical protein [Xanthomonas arboricola]
MRTTHVLALAALCSALAACTDTGRPAPTDQASAATPAAATPTAGPGAAAPSPDRTTALTQGVSQQARRYLCPQGPGACKASGPLVADSEAEAQWLLTHGYPTESERARLDTLQLDQLNAASQAGNQAATVVYGIKTAVAGRFSTGIGILRRAALAGNLYAYYGLSEVYASDTQHKNLVDSLAYLRLAYLLGDGKAARAIAAKGLSGVENAVADERAAALYKTFSNYQRPAPRPLD